MLNTLFFYKHMVYKHNEAEIRKYLANIQGRFLKSFLIYGIQPYEFLNFQALVAPVSYRTVSYKKKQCIFEEVPAFPEFPAFPAIRPGPDELLGNCLSFKRI